MGAAICAPIFSSAQKIKAPLPNWQNLDLKADGQFGISTEKAYNELLKGKKHVPVVVAVLDAGVDIKHEDLKKIMWVNPKETAANTTDDDKNGYADDVHGWSFLGSAKGSIQYDNLELVRQIRLGQAKFADPKNIAPTDKEAYKAYQKMVAELQGKIDKAKESSNNMLNVALKFNSMVSKMGSRNPSKKQFADYSPEDPAETQLQKIALENWGTGDFNNFMEEEIYGAMKHYREQLDYHFNINFDSRDTVGDNYADVNERNYGTGDAAGPAPDHGSHVAGIIAAVRDNDLGIKGVADDVAIMSVRTVPNGDERDKDVANAIRYAAANGAKVINMSFGKGYSSNKTAVDDAVKFAMSKDVLIVHSAGNDGKDNDKEPGFPNKFYEDKSGEAAAWIEIGASGYIDDETLAAPFSNYGKNTVDVYAPGVKINSTMPGSKYKEQDGTSMSAPVVSGLAALIRSYYPKLTALQVKEILMKSAVKVDHKVTVKNGDGKRKVLFSDICQTGGIVNAYEALKLAATY
ncbi:S8 family peptidase [Mucilaginibacter myungsuensis]